MGKVDPDPRIHLSGIVDPDPDPRKFRRCGRIQINAFLSGSGSNPRKEIEVDPDPYLDPERGLKWIRIRIGRIRIRNAAYLSIIFYLFSSFPFHFTLSFSIL